MLKKVAVVNRTTLKNYGSVLQCYALCEAIRSLGYDCEVIWQKGALSKNNDFRPLKMLKSALRLIVHPSLWSKTIKMARGVKGGETNIVSPKTYELFDEFVEGFINRRFLSLSEMKREARGEGLYKLVCGSDQVWCSTTLYVDPLMYLRFAPKEKRIAYAPSIGRDYIPKYNRRVMRRYINEIDYVSVRENVAAELIHELTGKNVPVVLDPTLLLPRFHWESISQDTEKKGYILCYFLSEPTKRSVEKIKRYALQNGLSVVALRTRIDDLSPEIKVDSPDCGPREFLGFIKGADLVITDSYHGMLFSTIFEKKYWSFHRESQDYDQSTRQLSVLSILGIEKRYVREGDDINNEPINYELIRPILEDEISKSYQYLKNALCGGV